MLLALLLAMIAVGVAVARGGSLDSLARTKFRWTWILFLGLAVQIFFEIWTPEGFPASARFALTLVTITAVLLFLVANRQLPGALIAAVGLALNVLVISVNGAMPVSLRAARVAGVNFDSFNQVGIRHEIADSATRLPWFADVLAIPHTHNIFSFGDVVLAAGLAILAYRCTLKGAEEEAPRPSRRSTSD